MALLDELKKLDIDPFDRVAQDQLPHDKKKPKDYLRCTNNFVNNKLAIRDHLKLRFKQTVTSSRLAAPKLNRTSLSPDSVRNLLPKLKPKMKIRSSFKKAAPI